MSIMAATLANGGVNPITRKKVVSPLTVQYVLPVMATAGLYDDIVIPKPFLEKLISETFTKRGFKKITGEHGFEVPLHLRLLTLQNYS